MPDAVNPQALNRYAYVYNSPIRYTDPNGYDPLDTTWEAAFRAAHGRDPSDYDRQLRLYSLMYNGPASNGTTWTSDDWRVFTIRNGGTRALMFQSTEGRRSLDDFVQAIGRLATHYRDEERAQFVSAIALIYAGVPYQPNNFFAVLRHGFGGAVQLRYLNHGMQGFNVALYNINPRTGEPEENTHHYAGHLLAGFYLGPRVNFFGTVAREVIQGGVTHTDVPDLWMGAIGGWHGFLMRVSLSPQQLPALIAKDLR